ncbi:hypothetical protein BDR26DRAFT_858076 [Obelidium mucronatum]|nr:hypothetical protein BDR26DRAFT_858076 [Obelidium mucronatum]
MRVFSFALRSCIVALVSSGPLPASVSQSESPEYDACQALTAPEHDYVGTSIFSVPEALSCFNQFPVTEMQRKDHISAIKRFVNFHPYLDQMKDSNPPYFPSKINLLQELDKIAEDKRLVSEHAFHNAIYTVINGLNDAHSNYDPLCFTNRVKIYQPFLMASVLDGKPPHVVIVDTVFKESPGFDIYWNASMKGMPASSFINHIITEIDGVDALTWIQQDSDAYGGKVRDSSARFNKALPSYQWLNSELIMPNGSFAVQNRIHDGIKPVISYTLMDPSQPEGNRIRLEVPWAVSPGNISEAQTLFSSSSDFYAKNCVTQIKKQEKFSVETLVKPLFGNHSDFIPSMVWESKSLY